MGKSLKSGWKTTEFWVASVLPTIAASALAVVDVVPPKVAAVLIVTSNVAYAISRGLAKGKIQRPSI